MSTWAVVDTASLEVSYANAKALTSIQIIPTQH